MYKKSSSKLPALPPVRFHRTLESLLNEKALRTGLLKGGSGSSVEPFEHLPYDKELALKNECLQDFWKTNALNGRLLPIVPSPLPRYYRATTKRKVVVNKGSLFFRFASGFNRGGAVAMSLLEPRQHYEIYRFLHEQLSLPKFRLLADVLSYIIIRNTTGGYCVVLNVRRLSAEAVRRMKTIAELLASAPLSVISCFALHGQSDSAYYLEGSRDSSDETWIKKLYGPKLVSLDIEGLRLKYPPQVFSQINESILPQMISVVRKMLAHGPETRLIDLYCGYGLFSHALAGSVREIVGIDYDRSAIKTASENAVHIGHGKKSVFMTAGITGEFLSSHLPTAGRRAEAVILDPPRNGSGAGVIAAIAERHPLSAVHICCGIDIIGNEIDLWKEHGYRPGEVVPFDMFPGTVNVETVMHLVPV